MGCGCKKRSSKVVRAYKNKNTYSKLGFSKPQKTKEEYVKELLERMRRATNK